jgi:hypothetical protein
MNRRLNSSSFSIGAIGPPVLLQSARTVSAGGFSPLLACRLLPQFRDASAVAEFHPDRNL